MNKVILMGRLTREPLMRYSQQGEQQMAVARYSLAVNRKTKKDGQQEADFINCIAFGKVAEFAERYLQKGTKVIVTGRIQTGSYTNKDGQKVYTTDVIVEECEFAESKAAGEQSKEEYNNERQKTDADGFMNIPDGVEDEGLPFN